MYIQTPVNIFVCLENAEGRQRPAIADRGMELPGAEGGAAPPASVAKIFTDFFMVL